MRLIDAECKELTETIGRIEFKTRKDILSWLDAAPTIDAKPVRYGHWVSKTDELGDEYTMCSNCMVEFKFKGTDGEMIYLDMKNTHYCPYCGAKNG